MTPEIYAHVLAAVRLILQDGAPDTVDTSDVAPLLETQVHALLWAPVTHAVHEVMHPSAEQAGAAPVKRDGRSKTWLLTVYFYQGEERIAETDTETMQGTGSLPEILERYATEMHPDDALFPSALTVNAIKDRLPQLRNNLGRYGNATLIFDYQVQGVSYTCQVDVVKPGA